MVEGSMDCGLAGLDRARLLAQQAQAERLPAQGGPVEETAQLFEALFATMLAREMRRGLSEGFFGGGAGADVYEGWLDEHVGQAIARSGDLGLVGMVKAGMGAAEEDNRPAEAGS